MKQTNNGFHKKMECSFQIILSVLCTEEILHIKFMYFQEIIFINIICCLQRNIHRRFFFLPVSFLLSAGKFKTAWANSWISNHFSSKTAISGQIQAKVKPFASEEKGWK